MFSYVLPQDLVICVDLSIQSPAIAITFRGFSEIYCFTNKTKKKIEGKFEKCNLLVEPHPNFEKGCGFSRYVYIIDHLVLKMQDMISHAIKNNNIEDIILILEGYSYSSKGLVFNIGEFSGLFKRHLMNMEIEPIIIPPSQWKKSIILHGNANKKLIYDTMKESEFYDLFETFKYKKLSWIEDVADVCAITKFVKEGHLETIWH